MTNTTANRRSCDGLSATQAVHETRRVLARVNQDLALTKVQLAATQMMIEDSREVLRRVAAARDKSSTEPA